MAFSLKKRSKSKLNITSISDDDNNALGEVLHRSTKTSKSRKSKKKSNELLAPDQLSAPDSDIDKKSRSSSVEHLTVYRNECPCETHYDKQLIEHSYKLNADKLFELVFGSNEFVRTYREAQHMFDDTATEWTMNEETKCRERTVNFKTPHDSSLTGKGVISSREEQKLSHEVAGSHYVLDTEVYSEGVKYCDTFFLHMRYCFTQTSPTTTKLRVTAQIRFCKSVNSIMKPLIERNVYSSSSEGLKDLNNRLNIVTNFEMRQRRLSRSETTLHVPQLTNERGRRMSRHDSIIMPLIDTHKKFEFQHTTLCCHPNKLIYFFIFITGLLLLIHLYLYLKLKHMDILIDNLTHLIKVSSSISTRKQKT